MLLLHRWHLSDMLSLHCAADKRPVSPFGPSSSKGSGSGSSNPFGSSSAPIKRPFAEPAGLSPNMPTPKQACGVVGDAGACNVVVCVWCGGVGQWRRRWAGWIPAAAAAPQPICRAVWKLPAGSLNAAFSTPSLPDCCLPHPPTRLCRTRRPGGPRSR